MFRARKTCRNNGSYYQGIGTKQKLFKVQKKVIKTIYGLSTINLAANTLFKVLNKNTGLMLRMMRSVLKVNNKPSQHLPVQSQLWKH